MSTIANDRVTFWFDIDKPRRYGDLTKSIQRYEQMSGKKYWHIFTKPVKKKRKGKKTKTEFVEVKKKANQKGSWHHIDCDRSNPHPNNLFWTESDQQHNNLHTQLHQANAEMIKSGVLGFDWFDKKYFVAWKPLADWIKSWREAGEPNWHHHQNLDMTELYKRMHTFVANKDKKENNPKPNAA